MSSHVFELSLDVNKLKQTEAKKEMAYFEINSFGFNPSTVF